MNYTQYSVEDLASDESFIAWATGRNPGSQKFWDDFAERNPEMKVKILQARTLVLNLAKAERRYHPEEQINRMWQEIDGMIESIPSADAPRRSYAPWYALAAALCAVFVGFIWYAYVSDRNTDHFSLSGEDPEAEFIEEVNTSGNVLRLHLSDGSTVALEDNSRLTYRTSYKGEAVRTVYLTGEAFFEVARDPAQPFLVHSNEVITRVLGTSFWVKAPDGEERVIVSVKTGKVSVYTVSEGEEEEQAQKNAVILLPNQQVTYQRDLETFGKGLVSQPEIISASIGKDDFNFENRPVHEVFDILGKAYGIEILFDEEVMSNCFFTAPLGSEPLYEKLKIICRAIGARYEIIDAKVVIASSGC